MKIKICGMKYPGNIEEVAALQPDYMGFIFYERSKRYVLNEDDSTGSDLAFQNTMSQLSLENSAIVKVGVFVNEPIKNLVRTCAMNEMDMVQLHGDEPPEYCEDLKLLDFKIIKAFGIDSSFDFSILEEYKEQCDYFMFDTKSAEYGGSGKKFNWDILQQYDNSKPVFLSGGLGLQDIQSIHDLLKGVNIHALDFNSKLELEPGLKDVEKCREVIQVIRTMKQDV